MPKTTQKTGVKAARLPEYVIRLADRLCEDREIGFTGLVRDLIVAEAVRERLLKKAGRCPECRQAIKKTKGGK